MENNQGQMPGDFANQKGGVPPEMAEAERELDTLIAKTFSTAAGKKTLQWLRDITIEQPSFQISEGLAGIQIGISREGQNALVRKIELRIDRAKAR